MLDFVNVRTASVKKDKVLVYPEFVVNDTKDLMARGKSFYAVWNEKTNLWETNEYSIQKLVDAELKSKVQELKEQGVEGVSAQYLRNYSTKKWTEWQTYIHSLPDNYHELDTKITFANTDAKKEDYISKRLPYAIGEGSIESYEELMDMLYDKTERDKLEWAIGAIISGDSKKIQKFIVLYGSAGSGKSTVLNIIQTLFEGYYSVFEAKALASSNNSFALEAFRTNPLVAIQHDGDLSRIEDNTKLNSIVSHETMIVNEKFKAAYSSRFNSFLFMGTNKPVKITDAKSGIIRRLIDVKPSGRKIPFEHYQELMEKIKFELGGIAHHCLKLYKKMGRSYYDTYKPTLMMEATNDFYNFVADEYDFFKDNTDEVLLSTAWLRYTKYCDDANVQYPFSKRVFKEELKNYFLEYKERTKNNRNVYSGFITDKFVQISGVSNVAADTIPNWIILKEQESIFDRICADCISQLANVEEKPIKPWDKVTTKLKSIDTKKLHYVRVPENHIVIDFDLKDENGNKSLELNLAEASKWPKTYAEVSKGGNGLHLHYIYSGDVTKLSRIYSEGIEVKVFTGKSSLRRRLTKCTSFDIATISSGLPLKGGKNVIDSKVIQSEKGLRTLILRCLNKEHHGATKPEIDFIAKILDDAYASGLKYDVSDMQPDIKLFAFNSTHNMTYCVDKVRDMKFCSDEPTAGSEEYDDRPIVFFDTEVYPNLFVIVWKYRGVDNLVSMVNPDRGDVEKLLKLKLVGFNNRAYDNLILYAWIMGYTNEQLFELSQKIINGDRGSKNHAKFSEAYNLSYADIYDFSSKKQSLKKWEIELGIHHQEMDWPWDQPVPDELVEKVVKYCQNDVVATEAVFEKRYEDFNARKILSELSGLTVNDTTRMHATKIIFGNDKHPALVYTDLSKEFPGYTFDPEKKKSLYLGEDPSEGGYVYAEPGIYSNVALLDIASLHPHSAIELNIFGEYTQRFKEIVDGRIAVKHRDKAAVKSLLNGVLEKYMGTDDEMDALAYALKIVINSVYGYTSATFDNPFRDPRNKDNIVAKRGALFMIRLKKEVQAKGYTVVHIKTDSIKIANATPEIIEFVTEYGKQYGYTFEHEDTYSKLCLVNDAVYIARYDKAHIDKKTGKENWWTATGKQFQVPYVFKTLFSKEAIEFEDLCETKEVSKGGTLYLDFNEGLPEGEHDYHFVGRIGQFCPMKPGAGGGELFREKDGKYNYAPGAKGYRWSESEIVKTLNKEYDIDRSYYITLVDAAIETISKYGDFEMFASNDPMPDMSFMNIPECDEEEIPF